MVVFQTYLNAYYSQMHQLTITILSENHCYSARDYEFLRRLEIETSNHYNIFLTSLSFCSKDSDQVSFDWFSIIVNQITLHSQLFSNLKKMCMPYLAVYLQNRLAKPLKLSNGIKVLNLSPWTSVDEIHQTLDQLSK
ncbi:hypothetical protein [Spartinivicinus poritis]|uniref:Maturase K n=1 Tax=Spartinivicinus poritis TaxID=2994640 RepID=A0ABT5UD66_9GAMM|nr:hypothetical protein [Spartinivicinus sp. A2-2]MDE1464319.1 hypothetical protein [Spartinivicinus sp. A2-2]